MSQSLKLSLVAVVALLLSACAGTGTMGYDFQRYQYTTIGTAVGAVAGGVLGHQMDRDDGRYYGAAAGALLGGAIGNNMDQMRAFNGASASANNPPYPQQDSRYSYNSGNPAYTQPAQRKPQTYPYY